MLLFSLIQIEAINLNQPHVTANGEIITSIQFSLLPSNNRIELMYDEFTVKIYNARTSKDFQSTFTIASFIRDNFGELKKYVYINDKRGLFIFTNLGPL